MTDEQWEEMLAIHLTAPFRLLRAATRLRELDASVIDATVVGVGGLTQTLSRGLRTTVTGTPKNAHRAIKQGSRKGTRHEGRDRGHHPRQ